MNGALPEARALSCQLKYTEMSFFGFWLNKSEFQLFVWKMRIPTTLSPTGQAEDQLAFVKLISK